MKKFWSILAIMTMFTTLGFAQRNPNAKAIKESQTYCPQLFNPTKFKVIGANPANASWTGKGGGGNLGGTGKHGNHVSTCGNWDMDFQKEATGAQIDAARANLNTEPSSWIFFGNSGACGYNSTPADSTHKRFRVMNRATDPLTHGALWQVPPSDPDTTFARSIRLGNYCGGGQQAECLEYKFDVKWQNALLVLYYAISLENALHSPEQNPEFVIQVDVGSPKVGGGMTWHHTDTLFYAQPSPQSSSNLGAFQNGGAGINGSSSNLYLPWNKVVINLGPYLNKTVRVSIGTGDCSMSVHYGYSYIAGYCRPMKIIADGCPIGSGNTVSTLRAPSGLKDPSYTADPNYKAYRWYRCINPDIVGDQISMTQGNDDTWFNANFELIPNANDSCYNTTINEFMMNGQFVSKRAYACEMTTYMNKTTNNNGIRRYPIKSRLFADASNQKPQLAFEQQAKCNGEVALKSTSTCGTPDYMKDENTQWTVYTNPACTGEGIVINGRETTFQSEEAGTYYVRMHVPTIDSICYNEDTIEIQAIENPVAKIAVSNEQPCLGDEISISDTSANVIGREWMFSDSSTSTEQTLNRAFTEAHDTIRLVVTNEYTEIIDNDLTNTRHCSDTAYKEIKVFTSPELLISDDTIVCEGQRTNVTVEVVDNDPEATYDYAWYRHLNRNGESSIQTGNILQQIPDAGAETSTYYVKVTRQPQGCEAWDSVTVRVVRPTIKMIPADGEICPDEPVKLIAGNAHHYSWTAMPEDLSLVGQESNDTITVTPSATTTYTLIGHGSDDCDADPLTKTVTLFPTPIPEIEITPGFVDSEDPTVTFNDASQYGVTTKWDFGNGNTSNQRQTSFTFNDISHSDYVTVDMTTFNALGKQSESCYANKSIDIPVQLFSVWIPNAFTPTLSENKTFKIMTANALEYFSVQIFDRNGQLVFFSSDQRFEWDGTYKGAICPQGAYVYIIKYRREGTPDLTTRKGTFSLIR